MNAKDAYTLLETLLDGIDPITGDMLPEEHVCQEPAVLRALHRALAALQNDMEKAANAEFTTDAERKSRYPRAGKPWTEEDDETLLEMWKRGESTHRIAKALQRSSYAVYRRMEQFCMDTTPDAPPLLPPWSLADVQKLQRMHASGCTAEEIAKEMRRPVESISARLFYMGLSKKAPISLQPQEPT